MTVSNLRQNIRIDVRGSQNKVKPGGTDERTITVKNWSQREVSLTLWVKPQDNELLRWYELKKIPSSENRNSDKKLQVELALPSKQEIEIILTFKVPLNAEPKTYNYEICAQDTQYKEDIPPCPQQLRVEASQQYLESLDEPSFNIEPKSNSEEPHLLKPGDKFNIKITIKNRSARTDWFYLTFPELDTAWFDNDTKSKLATGIQLNPRQEETFNISLCPPEVITAPGNYFSTVRLRSFITNTVILDMIYFHILVDDRLGLSDLSPSLQKIPTTNPSFEFKVSNLGNIQRNITFRGEDEEKLFTYKLVSHNLLLQPGDQEKVIFTPRLKPWWLCPRWSWRRPWKGEGQVIPFQIDASNINNELGSNLYIPEKPSGTIIWKAYSRGERWLLRILFLIILGFLLWGTIEIFVKPKVWEWIVKPSLQPKITELTTTKKSYQAGKGEGIRLNWEIRNIGQLNTIKITPLYNQESTTPYAFNLINKSNKPTDPDRNKQENFCNSKQTSTSGLIKIQSCWFVQTVLIILKPKKEQETREFVEELRVDNLGFCKLISTVPDTSIPSRLWEAIYSSEFEMKSHLKYKDKVIQCRNILAIPFPINRYQSNDTGIEIKTRIEAKYQNKLDVQTNNKSKKEISYDLNEGNYGFKIDVITDNVAHTPSVSKTIKDTIVAPAPKTPAPLPEITNFALNAPSYRKKENSPTTQLELNWVIANPQNIMLELQPIKTTFEGLVSKEKPITYYFNQAGKPIDINKQPVKLQCSVRNNLLTCENIPIQVKEPGQYKFILTAIQCQDLSLSFNNRTNQISADMCKSKEIYKIIESVQVKPTLPEITSFKAELPTKPEDKIDENKTNDKDNSQNPSYIYMVDPAKDKGAINVNLSWDIKASDPVTVELLPAPGVVERNVKKPNLKNNMQYSLSPNPGATTVTLKVTNQAGESVTRTLVLQTALIIPPPATNNAASKKPQVPSVPPPPLPDGAAPSGSGSPSNPEELAPLELPPRAN